MRGTQRSLGVAFPNMRLPLEQPVTRRLTHCEPPTRPPLPFVPFPSAGYWHEEFPDLFAAATGAVIDDVESPLALYGDAELHGAALHVFSLPVTFRDALVKLDAPGQELLAHRWNQALAWDRDRVKPSYAERRVITVRDLATLSRDAAAADEHLYIWSNT